MRTTPIQASPIRFGNQPAPAKKRVVIVGNGIGGVTAGRELQRLLKRQPDLAQVTILGKCTSFIFKPYLTDMLNRKVQDVPMTKIFPAGSPVQFQQTEVQSISTDPANKVLKTTQGDLPYDYLIVAAGGKTAYFNVKRANSHALPLENPNHINQIKDSVVKKLSEAAKADKNSTDEGKNLSFVIVGAGATGIELAFDLNRFIQEKIQNDFPALSARQPRVTLIETMDDILPGFNDAEKAYVKEQLKAEGIELLLKTGVVQVNEDESLRVKDKNVDPPREYTIFTKAPMWVTGVRANPLVETMGVPRKPGKEQVLVNEFLEVPNRDDLYVIGDSSAAKDAKTGNPLPPTGQVAEQEGRFAARDLFSKLSLGKLVGKARKPFVYKPKGLMMSLGPEGGFVRFLDKYMIKGKLAHKIRDHVYKGKHQKG